MEELRQIGTEAPEKMTIEQWLAIRKEAALKIDPETAEVEWIYAQTLVRTVSTPSFRRNTGRSGGNTSPDLPEVTCGCGLETCPTQSEVRYGKSTSQSWPSQQDFMTLLAFEAVTAGPPNGRGNTRP
jgi:hypothetical protein